jgi:hypothetical protein
MTPKEKAKELVNKYYNKIEHTISNEYESITKEITKECALIAVDEILSELAYTQNYVEDAMNKIQVYISYWQEVKQEIENL